LYYGIGKQRQMAQFPVPNGVGVMDGSTENGRYLLMFGNV